MGGGPRKESSIGEMLLLGAAVVCLVALLSAALMAGGRSTEFKSRTVSRPSKASPAAHVAPPSGKQDPTSLLRSDLHLRAKSGIEKAIKDAKKTGILASTLARLRSWILVFASMMIDSHMEVHLTPTAELEETSKWVQTLRNYHNKDKNSLHHMAQEKVILDALSVAAQTATPNAPCALCMMKDAVEDLRVHETEYEFQNPDKKAEIVELSKSYNVSAQNFVYGTTPFPTWLQLFQQPILRAATMASLMTGKHLLVLGSSNGWIPLYAASTFGIRSLGIELLEYRAKVAHTVKQRHYKHGLETVIDLLHGDALASNVTQAAIIYMTSLVWAPEFKIKIHEKLAKEASSETIIVANDFELAELGRPDLAKEFEVLHVTSLPTSWNEAQKFVMYRKKSEDGPIDKFDQPKPVTNMISGMTGYVGVMQSLKRTIDVSLIGGSVLELALNHMDPELKAATPLEKVYPLTLELASALNKAVHEHMEKFGLDPDSVPEKEETPNSDVFGANEMSRRLESTKQLCPDQWILAYAQVKGQGAEGMSATEQAETRAKVEALAKTNKALQGCFDFLDKMVANGMKLPVASA